MTAIIMTLDRSSSSKPTSYSQILEQGKDLCSYCMMLLQQLDVVRSGHEISITRRYPVAAIKAAQKELKEIHGFPTTFSDGGSHGFGLLTFQ